MPSYVEYNSLPCSSYKLYDDEVIAGRFRFQLSVFEMLMLMGLSRILSSHVAYICGKGSTALPCRTSLK